MAESRRGSYRMWGDDGGSIVDCSDVGAARGVARSGAIIRSGGGRSRSGDAAVAGRLAQRSDCGGVLRAAGQRAALALDIWPRGGSRAARAQGARPRAGQSLPRRRPGARAALTVVEEVLAPGVSDRPNWTLPRLADAIEKRTGQRISKSRLSVVLRKKGASAGAGRATR